MEGKRRCDPTSTPPSQTSRPWHRRSWRWPTGWSTPHCPRSTVAGGPVRGSSTPYASCNYWDGVEAYDTCTAECRAELLLDAESRRQGWERFKSAPPPLGYDPAIIPQWQDGPDSPAWGVLRLEPWHLRVFPGTYARSGGQIGQILTWQEGEVG